MSYVMQARSSVDGQMKTWVAGTADWAGAGFPGPGTPEHIAIAGGYVTPGAPGAGSVTEDSLSGELARELLGATPAPTLIYVSTAGNDAAAGTVGAPVATPNEALRRVGRQVRANCEIRIMTPGTFVAAGLAVSRDFGPYLVDIVADESTEIVVETGSVQSATYQVISVTTDDTWAPDAHAGLKFRVTSGVHSGQERTVIANAATTATLLDGFASNLAPGTTFEITRPGVFLEFPAYGVIAGDSRGYLSLRNVELSWPDDSGLYFFGSTYLVGVTAQPGASRSSKFIYGYYGAPYCDLECGFGWRANGAVPCGDVFVTASSEFTLAGRLGYVALNNCGGVGHSSGVFLRGRLALDSTSSDLVIGIQGYGGNRPEVLFDDIGASVSNGPVWMLGGRGEVNCPMRIGGSGAHAGRFCMRDQAFLELGRAVAAGFIDVALGSELRMASAAGDGGFSQIVVDGVNAYPLAGFEASGDYYMGSRGSFAGRD